MSNSPFTYDVLVKYFKEAIDTTKGPEGWYHPEKLAEDHTMEEYLHMLYSDNYEKVIERLAHYARVNPEQLGNYPLTQEVVRILNRIFSIESSHKEKLEKLAVKLVLGLEEMHTIVDAINDGVLKIDAKISAGQLQNAITDIQAQEMEEQQYDEEGEPTIEGDQLTDEEKLEIGVAMSVMGSEEIKDKRNFADILRYGEAFNHLYSFNLVRDKLDEINPELAGMYGVASSIVQVLYYMDKPGGEEQAAGSSDTALGSVELEEEERQGDEGVYVIKARAQTFSFLVHEIVKGIQQYIGLTNETMNQAKLGSLENETRKARYAQAFVNKNIGMIRDYAPGFIKHKLEIYQKLIALPAEQQREVLAGGGKARAILKNIIDKMAKDYDLDLQTGDRKEEEYKDSDGDWGQDEGREDGGEQYV